MSLVLFLFTLFQTAAGGSIQGTVVNAANEGIFSARVEITGGPQGPIVTRTDGQGRFGFTNLVPGVYRVTVKKEEYIRQEFGQKGTGGSGLPVVIERGTRVDGLVFRLQPAATLAGKVANEDGIPVANILVQAMRRTYGVRGNRTITVFSNALTDDLGVYRLYWIDPGDYYVNATYLPQLPTPVNANDDAPRVSYGATYYPGFTNAVDAKEVRLTGGHVFGGIDFRLEKSPAMTVRGTVRSVLTKAAVPATVTLIAPDESGGTARYIATTDGKGVFEMKNVNQGTYVLMATTNSGESGFSTIKATATCPNPLLCNLVYAAGDIPAGPGITMSIRVFGDAPPSADLRMTKFLLLPVETYLPAPQPSIIGPNGTVTIQNVQPGEYLLSASGLPETAYMRAANMQGRDVLERSVEAQYDLRAPLDIQLAFDGGQISGTVADNANRAVDRATVILIPDKARRHRPDQYRVVVSTTDGRFSIVGIPPGEYKAFAWDAIEQNAWLNAEFMASYEEFGTPVTVGPTQKLTATIRVIPAGN
jgi:hypothetical protein